MLLISYHIISYTFHIHFLCVYFSFSFMFMPANTLGADTGKLCVPEGAITVRDSDLYRLIPEGIITVRDSDLCHMLFVPEGTITVQDNDFGLLW